MVGSGRDRIGNGGPRIAARSSVQQLRKIATHSSSTSPRRSKSGAPSATNSSASQPAPAPKITRPFDSESREASCFAVSSGLRCGSTRTPVPSSTRLGTARHDGERDQRVIRNERIRAVGAAAVVRIRGRRLDGEDDVIARPDRVVAQLFGRPRGPHERLATLEETDVRQLNPELHAAFSQPTGRRSQHDGRAHRPSGSGAYASSGFVVSSCTLAP